MHNIRKIGLRLLLIVVVIGLYEAVIKYAYEPYNVTVHYSTEDKKDMEGTIDTLFCGTSLFRSINLDMIDEELDATTYIAISSAQPTDGSYYTIVDTVEKNPVKTVFMSMSADGLMKDAVATKWKALVYDSLSPKNKMQYLFHGTKLDEWPYITLYSVRIEDYLAFSDVWENITTKRTEEYAQGLTHTRLYQGRGRFGRKTSYDCKITGQLKKKESTFKTDELWEHQEKYLKKIIDYCKKQDIELIFVYTPFTRDKVNSYKNFEPIHDYFKELAEKNQIPYWDFNYYKDLENVFTEELFEDEKHLNLQGGDVLAEKLLEVYESYKNGEGVEQYFQNECPYYQ